MCNNTVELIENILKIKQGITNIDIYIGYVLVSWGFYNKLSQTIWLNRAEMYSLTFLEPRIPKSRRWHKLFLPVALRENLFQASFLLVGEAAILSVPWFVHVGLLQSQLQSSQCLPPLSCVCLSSLS